MMQLALKIQQGTFERIPICYSDELWRVIQWMLLINPKGRPSVNQLLEVPRIANRIRLKKIEMGKKKL